MAKYLIQANYVGEGVKGLLKEGGSSRIETVRNLVGSMGGSIESIYYAFGEYDVYSIVEMPDHATMSAFSLAVNATGMVTIKTTVLMTPEDIDEAAKKTPDYRPPGQ